MSADQTDRNDGRVSDDTDGPLTSADLALGGVRQIARLPGQRYSRRPPRAIAGLADRWRRRYAKDRAVTVPPRGVYVFENAYTFGHGFVARRDGTVYPGTIPPRFIDADGRRKRRWPGLRNPVEHEARPIILAINPGYQNYGHWLVDTLARVAWARALPGLGKARVMIHERSSRVAVDLPGRIGVEPDEILTLGPGGAFCPVLVYPSMWGHQSPGSHAPECFHVLDRIREAVPQTGAETPRRIFLGRDDARHRHLTNEAALLPVLTETGYVKVNAGFLTLDEQIRLFSNAESIVAISGAGLANMAFCSPGCRIINIAPESMSSTFFWDLAHHRDTPYSIYYARASDPALIQRSDLTLDVEDFLGVFHDTL